MATNIRHVVFIVLGIAAFLLTWPHAFDWMRRGGNILDPVAFFRDAIAPGGTAAFLSLDMLFAWITYMIWVVFDAKRIGLGLILLAVFAFDVSSSWPSWRALIPVLGTALVLLAAKRKSVGAS